MRSQENEDEDESSSSSSSSTSSAFDLSMRGPSNGFFWTRSTVDAHHCTGATFTFTALSTAMAEPVAVMHVLKGALGNQVTDRAALLSSLMVNQQLLDAMPLIFARNSGSCISCLPGCSSCYSGLLRCTACSGGFTRVSLSSLLSPPHGSPEALLLDALAVCLPGMAVHASSPPPPSRAVTLSGPPGIQVRVLQPAPAPAPAPAHFDPVSVLTHVLSDFSPAAPAPAILHVNAALELMPPPHAPAPAVAPVPLKWAPAPTSISLAVHSSPLSPLGLGLVPLHSDNTAVVPAAGIIATVAAVSALGFVLLLLSCILAGRKQRRKVSNIIFIDADPESPGASCPVAKADKDTNHGMTL